RKKDPKFTLIPDAVHPGAGGQAVMASALIADLGLPARVATLSISKGDDDRAAVQAAGGKVSDARFTSEGLEFTFLADGLPFILPQDADVGYGLAKIGHRLSRDAIEIHGLPSGEYQLFVSLDGSADRLIGTFKSQDLEDSIELQGNAKMPQHEQAATVVELNAQRNREAVQPLRMLWRSKKQLARSEKQLKQSPDNKKAKAEVARLEKELEDFEGQIKRFEVAATKIEDQIYQTNQPKPRRYRLIRQGT
ncbi:MAG TPA: hypothetical protein VHV77_14615, partial [Pirellulales bacterium]|nr:hypothetical protein [Pirellulales bacterium]